MTGWTRRNRRRAATALATGVLAALAVACSGGGDGAGDRERAGAGPGSTTSTTALGAGVTVTAPVVPPGGFEVATHTETLVDDTRPTQDLPDTGVPPSDSRTLVTTFTYPDAPGRFPLLVFAHGHNGHPRKFSELFAAWAAAGFVVAAPTFPLSNDEVPGRATVFDLASQPGDMSFVISESLRLAGEPGSFLQGRVNPEEIAVGGLSLGGATAYQVAFDDCCLDPRVDAVMALEAPHPDTSGLDLASGLPLLVMHADQDPVIPFTQGEEAFAAAAAPKYFVTIHEAAHASPYEDTPDPADAMVIDTTTAFWRLYVAHDAGAAVDLSEAARVQGLTTVVEQPG